MNGKALFVPTMLLGLLGGCTLEKTDDADEFRQAIPSADSVAVDGPETTGTTSHQAASGARGSLTGGDGSNAPAYWYTFTRNVRDGVNVVTAAILGTVSFVVHTEPTNVSSDEAVWGPYDGDALDPVTWRLTVTRIGEHHYRYVVEGRKKSDKAAPFLTILDGDGYDQASAKHGDGAFTLDLDNAKALDPSRHTDDSGSVTIEHDLPEDIGRRVDALPRSITATLDPETGESLVISSTANEDHTGTLEVTGVVDVNEPKDGLSENVSISSRWRETGAGRSDITIAHGSVPGEMDPVTATECWGTDFSRVYYGDSGEFSPTEGDPGLCTY